MEIVKYPDPILRRGGQPIEEFDQKLADTAQKMLEAMYVYGGVGLAAPQVGLEISLLVLNPSGDRDDRDGELALVNPKVTARKGECRILSETDFSSIDRKRLQRAIEAFDAVLSQE